MFSVMDSSGEDTRMLDTATEQIFRVPCLPSVMDTLISPLSCRARMWGVSVPAVSFSFSAMAVMLSGPSCCSSSMMDSRVSEDRALKTGSPARKEGILSMCPISFYIYSSSPKGAGRSACRRSARRWFVRCNQIKRA